MGSEPRVLPGLEPINSPVLQKFKLYKTRSNFYLIGRDKNKTFRRVLKIDRTDPTELNVFEDPTEYSKAEWHELRKRIDEGNKKIGGLEKVTTCYGIVGFIRFLEPYYMLLITRRKKIGVICGHTIYGIAESQMIAIPITSVQTEVADSEDEKRYKKLLCVVDLTRNFYFSYTYHLMYSLQKNICKTKRGKAHYESMFVWNAFLTRRIRNKLQNTMWTVALVYGFFQQTKHSISGRDFVLTVIARRSRHYAGTRYLRRGVNEKGRVANDVEMEQIVFEDAAEGYRTPGCRIPISSVVQNRGSIPLFWSQETSLFNPQPDIKLYKKERSYEATQLHFNNLKQRYGDPIIILNLIKASEKRRRETILRAEFAKAILFINRGLRKENRLKAIHFDLNKHYRNGAASAFSYLCRFATISLDITGIFYCEGSASLGSEGAQCESCFGNTDSGYFACHIPCQHESSTSDASMLQTGVLRTNCIDCLDHTNFAQYAFGLVALGRQLRALGTTGPHIVGLDNPLALNLMEVYQTMGDTLALQYGGSEAHNKMFCELRGEWNPTRKPREILTSLSRHYSNAYLDGQKQNAINVFLGHFRPQLGRPTLWELDSDQHYNIGRHSATSDNENPRPSIRRSLSFNIIVEGDLTIEEAIIRNIQLSHERLNRAISKSNPDFSFSEAEASCSGFSSAICCGHHLREMDSNQMFPGDCTCSDSDGHDDQCTFANLCKSKFSSALGSFGNCSSMSWNSSDNIYTDMDESITSTSRTTSSELVPGTARNGQLNGGDGNVLVPGFSNAFTRWVFYGRIL